MGFINRSTITKKWVEVKTKEKNLSIVWVLLLFNLILDFLTSQTTSIGWAICKWLEITTANTALQKAIERRRKKMSEKGEEKLSMDEFIQFWHILIFFIANYALSLCFCVDLILLR